MKDLLIISVYDDGYFYSVMNNGRKLEQEKAREIAYAYLGKRKGDFLKWAFATFKKDILICEDGDIERFEYKETDE